MTLAIHNLSVEQSLDAAKMRAVRGGSVFANLGTNAILGGGGLSFGSGNMINAPVTQVDASQRTRVDLSTVSNSISNMGGIVAAAQV